MNDTAAITKDVALHEGKAKIIYSTSDPERLIQFFKDDASAFNGKKKGTIVNKGVINNAISSSIFRMLEKEGIATHFVDSPKEREMLVKKVEIIPVEVVIRNVVAGSLAKRMGIEENTPLKETIIEYYYKDDDLGDPMINQNHIRVFDLATDEEMETINRVSLKINDLLVRFFDSIGIRLVDYKLEFGRSPEGILLADEISPDGCRLWDKSTGEKLDKDRFRRDLGNVEQAYEMILKRVTEAIS
ncbi:Phosphoribosylaminoimidazole-succinocarboxamide synthase [hydrothermal vent metagenome]|uniref:phosphoribosylaminoimidazolesuccinocarboxamide synthase n=1 Tax=hydrothermal vent metagenome TaxID=652676 RepID=A0A3B1C737_9ZZZZ